MLETWIKKLVSLCQLIISSCYLLGDINQCPNRGFGVDMQYGLRNEKCIQNKIKSSTEMGCSQWIKNNSEKINL